MKIVFDHSRSSSLFATSLISPSPLSRIELAVDWVAIYVAAFMPGFKLSAPPFLYVPVEYL